MRIKKHKIRERGPHVNKKKRKVIGTDREDGQARAKKSRKYYDALILELSKKAEQGGLNEEQIRKALQALRAIAADPHVTGVRSATPKISIESINSTHIITKISISTAKTRKQFFVRRGL